MKEGHSLTRQLPSTSPRDDSRSLLQLLAQRGHLDVEGGRERDGSWRERKEEAPARKSLLDGCLLVTLGDGKECSFQMFLCPEELSPKPCGYQK